MTQLMQQWQLTASGRAHLGLAQVALPEPGPGEVRVKVQAVALNHRDLTVMEAWTWLTFPLVLASDMAGVVDKLGPCCDAFRVGDRVISSFAPEWLDGKLTGPAVGGPDRNLGAGRPGVLAEYVVLPATGLVSAPKTLTDVEASTLTCAGLTAWFAMIEKGGLKAGDKVLIQGTGGVALFALQLAKAHGAEVFLTSGDAEKGARAKALGADYVLDRHGDWVAELLALTQNQGVEQVLNNVGGANLAQALSVVAVEGYIAMIGAMGDDALHGSVSHMLVKAPTIKGIHVGHRRALVDLVRAVDAINLKPIIDATYPWAALPAALEHLARGAFGKVVVTL
ncbi:MAG: NAD(P)-dependent alcohol dehydrogenase [Neisseriaceae bacterium]|nr:NAD(P)-dependent alcohol dehydrogenase [Neisseriaceae bacterium]MBP6862501.1 NAD(P)-dependent alcohol dehydrogenase [Neisseriaceae bacterium]